MDPVARIMAIGERFNAQAQELDERAADAVDDGASEAVIMTLVNSAATFRLRALSAYQAAAPYCRPR